MKTISEGRALLLTVISGVMSYLEPIAGNVFAIAYLLVVNFVVGLLAAHFVTREDFSWRKMGWCGLEALVFFALVASIYVVGSLNGNSAGAIQCVSMVVYSMTYFYSVRILRNLRSLLRQGTVAWLVVDFLYALLTLEATRRIPGLETYLRNTQKQKRQLPLS